MKKAELERIVTKQLDATLLSYLDKSKGEDHKVYILKTTKGDYVLREPLTDAHRKLMSQSYAMNAWRKKGVPVPKQIKKTRKYIIEEYIEGKDIQEAKPTYSTKKRLMKELGMLVRKMHDVKTKQYGYFKHPGIGEFKTWKEQLDKDLYVHLNSLQRHRLYTKTEIEEFRRLHRKNKQYHEDVSPSLLHQDLTFENVIVKRRINGIIDAGDVISGDPVYELACMHQHYRSRKLSKPILDGYGEVDMHKLYYYALFQSLWWVWYFSKVKRGNHPKRVKMERSNVEHYLKKLK